MEYPSSRHHFEVHASSVCGFTSSCCLAHDGGLCRLQAIGPSVVCLVADWEVVLFLAILIFLPCVCVVCGGDVLYMIACMFVMLYI